MENLCPVILISHPTPAVYICRYVINVRQIAKFVVGLGPKVSPTDIEEGMRVGVDRTKYHIQVLLLIICGTLFSITKTCSLLLLLFLLFVRVFSIPSESLYIHILRLYPMSDDFLQIPLPPKIDPSVSLMTVEDKPDVT